MFSKAFRILMRRVHRWAGVIIGLQLFVWVISGAYFAWISIDFVKGDDRALKLNHSPLNLDSLAPVSSLVIPNDFQPISLFLENTPRGLTYRVANVDGKRIYFDAVSGASLEVLSPSTVIPLAVMQEQAAEAKEALLVEEELSEFRGGPLPVYQVFLNDWRQTKLYADAYTGKVLARRNRFWRIYDFFWMLHIMDFKSRTDMNNYFLKTLSIGALAIVLSGYFLFAFGRMPARGNSRKSSFPQS